MTLFVESVDVDAAWEAYYQLADRRHKPGLTFDELRQVIEAALVGVVEAREIPNIIRVKRPSEMTGRVTVSPWVRGRPVTYWSNLKP